VSDAGGGVRAHHDDSLDDVVLVDADEHRRHSGVSSTPFCGEEGGGARESTGR